MIRLYRLTVFFLTLSFIITQKANSNNNILSSTLNPAILDAELKKLDPAQQINLINQLTGLDDTNISEALFQQRLGQIPLELREQLGVSLNCANNSNVMKGRMGGVMHLSPKPK